MPTAARALLGRIARGLPHGVYGRNRLLEFSRTARGRYAGMVAHALPPAEGGVASAAVAAAGCDLDRLLDRWYAEVPARDAASTASFVDLVSYLPGDILTKVDRMSMAVSLEARVPLLDHHLVEFATSMPGSLRLRDGTGKWVWRKAIRGLVPDDVLTRPKQGFALPLGEWFRKELRGHVQRLLRREGPLGEFVEPRAVARVVSEHMSRRRDHRHLIWKLLVLGIFLDRCANGHRPDRAPHPEMAVRGL